MTKRLKTTEGLVRPVRPSQEAVAASPTPSYDRIVTSGFSVSAANDPQLLFTGPSPFGGHRYALFDLCPRRYGLEHEHYPMPYYDQNGVLSSPPEVHIDPLTIHDDWAEAEGTVWELVRGTMIHTGLAHHYAIMRARQKGDDETINRLYSPIEAMRALARYEKERKPEDTDLWDSALELGQRILPSYANRYAFEKLRIEVVEEVFALNMGEAPYTFRLDLGVRDTLGKFWFVDHKTTTRLRKDHGVIYGLSIQFQAYAIAGQAIMADRYGGVMANMIECGEDALKFERPRMPSIPGFLMGFAERIETIYRQMKALVDAGLPPSRWPKRPGFGTCRAYGKMCPFYDRCRLNA